MSRRPLQHPAKRRSKSDRDDRSMRACGTCRRSGVGRRCVLLPQLRVARRSKSSSASSGDHQKRLLELLPSKSFPDAEVLIVVRPNDTALHDHLQRAFAGKRAVKVIMERRVGDRRAAQAPVADERRHRRTRRIRQGDVSSLGYTVVRFMPKAIVFLKGATRRRQRGPEAVPRTLV